MIDTTYLTDKEKEELEAWRKRWLNHDPKMEQLREVQREQVKTEVNCKLSHTTVNKAGKAYHYPPKEISYDQLSTINLYKYASEPDVVRQLDTEDELLMRMELYQKLDNAMASLSQEDKGFILELVVGGKTEREMAAEMGTYQKKINRRKNDILKKLRKFF